ncbi:hypothetical protein JRY02_20690 [Enterobacter roggenkampii]|nr:hypothetical protein [Enterobacter roggenkampii]
MLSIDLSESARQETTQFFFCDDSYYRLALQAHYSGIFYPLNTPEDMAIFSMLSEFSAERAVIVVAAQSETLNTVLDLAGPKTNHSLIIIIDTPLASELVCRRRAVVLSKYCGFKVLDRVLRYSTRPLNRKVRIPSVHLTVQESDVWYLIRSGMSVDRVARLSGLTNKTIYYYKASVMQKMGLKRKNQMQYLRYGRLFSD